MHVVYVLKSEKDGNLYIGCTSNLNERIAAHNSGKVRSTKSRVPLELIFSESYVDKYQAFLAERMYKTAKGKRILKEKIKNCQIV